MSLSFKNSSNACLIFASLNFILLSPNVFAKEVSTTTRTLKTTEVIIFKPSLPDAKKTGSCWTGSIANTRTDAWRCQVGNSIFDPCFETDNPKQLICDASPFKEKSGFVLTLSEPLPKTKGIMNDGQTKKPWLIKLADGSTCSPYTGTMPMVDHKPVYYHCDDSIKDGKQTGLLEIQQDKPLWQAKKVYYHGSAKGEIKYTAKHVPILTVWE